MQHFSPSVRGLKPPRITAPKIVNDKNGHELAVNCMAWSCDGLYLATGSDDKTVKLWQYKAVATSPFSLVKANGSLILSCSDDRDIFRESLAESSSITACAPITGLVFSPRHPEILAVASHVNGWQPAAYGIDGGIQTIQVVQRLGSREGRLVGQDPSLGQIPVSRPRVTIWNTKTRQPITTILLSHNPVSMTFHPSSYQLIIVCMDKSAVDYAVPCWQERTSISDADNDNAYGSPLSRESRPTEDDESFVPIFKDDTAVDMAERRKRKEDVDGKQKRQKGAETEGDEGWTVRRDIELVLKDRAAEMKSYGFESGVSELNGACFSPCGTRLYTGNHDGTVHIWYYPVIPELPEDIGTSVSPVHASTEPGLTTNASFHHHPVDSRDDHTDDARAAVQPVNPLRTNAPASLAVEDDMSGAARATDQGEPENAVGTSGDTSIIEAGGLTEVSNEIAKAKPIKWLKRYETNQGCVNCIDMDPRRR